MATVQTTYGEVNNIMAAAFAAKSTEVFKKPARLPKVRTKKKLVNLKPIAKVATAVTTVDQAIYNLGCALFTCDVSFKQPNLAVATAATLRIPMTVKYRTATPAALVGPVADIDRLITLSDTVKINDISLAMDNVLTDSDGEFPLQYTLTAYSAQNTRTSFKFVRGNETRYIDLYL